MQINKISQNVPKKLTKVSTERNINIKNQTPPFKGGIDSFCLGVANAIENGGLFVSFTLQDMLGTNLPRPLMGLVRNSKENKGKKNIRFAAKEMVREFTTGPSMFIIPGVLLALGKKIFGKATEIPLKLIKSFGNIHAANPLNEAGEAITKQEFFKNVFSQIIKNSKGESEVSKQTLETATDFAQRLADGIKNNNAKSAISGLTDDFIELAKNSANDAVHTDFTQAIISDTAQAPFKNTVNFMMSYADDVVEKASKQSPDRIKDFIKKISNNKTIGRCAANIFMYGMILLFLQVIPKLYNKAEGKDNAGLKGLMKEETFNDKSSEMNTQKDKSTPSFGSAASIAESLAGNGTIGKIAKGIEFEGCNMSFPLLLGVMGLGILLPRTLQAKDKYDREEILRRDLTTCATMCFAEKELRKGFSKLNEAKSGLVLASKDKNFYNRNVFKRLFDYLRPIKGVRILNTQQIVSKYSNIDKYKEGIKGFCNFIDGQGGNLGKVFSLTEESKNIVQGLLKNEGHDIASADNSIITSVLEKAKDSDEVNKLIEMFKDKNNPWITKAKTLNARFTALSVIVLVPLFLGFFLPWINEKSTKKRIKEEQALSESNIQNKITMPDSEYFKQSQKSKEIFADFQKSAK